MSYERIVVIGNIGSVEVLKSNAGNEYIRMTAAVNRGSGELKSVAWYSVLFFNGFAREKDKFLSKYKVGKKVVIEGRPQVEAFIKKDGSPGLDNTIIAISMPELLD